MSMQLVFQIINLLWITKVLALAAPLARSGCKEMCGGVQVPFPFGIEAKCSRDPWFTIDCNNNTNPATLILKKLGLDVLNISLEDGTVVVNYPVLYSANCSGRNNSNHVNLEGSPFIFSESDNIFTAVGCNKRALMTQDDSTIWGCESTCNENNNYNNCSSGINCCNGINCCKTTIPGNLTVFNVTWSSIDEGGSVAGSGCEYAFLVQQNSHAYNFTNPFVNSVDQYLPAVLEWSFYDASLYEAYLKDRSFSFYCSSTYRLVSHGFRCRCQHGYEGNPYLFFTNHTNACQDIDECNDPKVNPCGKHCVNTPGYYSCDNKYKMIIIGVSSGFGSLFLLIGAWGLYIFIKKRNRMKRRQKFFKRNGGLLLQQQLSASDGGVEKTKLFSSKELETATDNYNENRVLGRGGQGTVYKGMLTDGRIVAVKKSMMVNEANVEQFINEVVIVSQINHRNVVNLLGCCLETEVPLLVYEFISNGTLFQHIHDPSEEFPLSWEMRLRIATEIAGALFYLHSAASIPIYHRDIKSTNILLDDKYKAKVSDFGTSRSVAIDQTHLTTLVQGTFGYLDPEYFQSSQFTDKSDVYSFGVVMVELLTSEKPISLTRSEESRSLTAYFIQSMEENHLFEILDPRVMREGRREELIAVAHLAKRCLHLNGKRRPTMKEVAVELEGIRISQGGSIIQQNYEEVECITIEMPEVWDTASTSTKSCFDIAVTPSSLDAQPLLRNKS